MSLSVVLQSKMIFQTFPVPMVVILAIIQTVCGVKNGYLPEVKVDLTTADQATYQQYLFAIRRKDPCKNLGVCTSMWVSQAHSNANEACKIALLFWDNLGSAAKIKCSTAFNAACRPTGRARCCPHLRNQECSFECTRNSGRATKFLSDLVKLPEESNPTAVKMYDIKEIISGL